MTSPAAASPEASLVRALGVRQLAASIVNVTVGAGIFVLPAAVAAGLGAAAPAAYLVCAAAMTLIVTSFALAGSRVSLTGGIYAYVEVAFGPFVGFLAGVLQWLMLWLTAGGLLSAFVDQVGLLVPGAGQGLPRAAIIVATVAFLAFVNVRGVAIGARVIEGAVVAKLLPLAVFLAVGVFFIQPAALAWPGWPAGGQARRDGAAPHLRVRRDRGGARSRAARCATRGGRFPARSTWRSGSPRSSTSPSRRSPRASWGRRWRSTPRPRSPPPPPASSARAAGSWCSRAAPSRCSATCAGTC